MAASTNNPFANITKALNLPAGIEVRWLQEVPGIYGYVLEVRDTVSNRTYTKTISGDIEPNLLPRIIKDEARKLTDELIKESLEHPPQPQPGQIGSVYGVDVYTTNAISPRKSMITGITTV